MGVVLVLELEPRRPWVQAVNQRGYMPADDDPSARSQCPVGAADLARANPLEDGVDALVTEGLVTVETVKVRIYQEREE